MLVTKKRYLELEEKHNKLDAEFKNYISDTKLDIKLDETTEKVAFKNEIL